MTQGDPGSVRVPAPEGWTAPRFLTYEVRLDHPPCDLMLDLVIQNGLVFIAAQRIEAIPGRLLSQAEMALALDQVRVHVEEALTERLRPSGTTWDEPEATWDTGLTWDPPVDPQEAREVARIMMRRRITPEFLADVVKANREGGIPAILERYGGVERNARRWLARAKEAGIA